MGQKGNPMTDTERKASIALLGKLRGLLADEYRKVAGEENHAATRATANDMRMFNALEEYFKAPPMTAQEYLLAKRSMLRVCMDVESCEGCPMNDWRGADGKPCCAAHIDHTGDELDNIEKAIKVAQRWAREHPDMITS